MESQPQNPEFRINPENFHPYIMLKDTLQTCMHSYLVGQEMCLIFVCDSSV